MALTINTNVTSMIAQRNLNSAQDNLSESMRRLSSGMRINRARDDAAGLAISRIMTKKIIGYQQGNRNANDGISLVQTTEGAMSEIENNLQRMRELAIQSANGTYVASDRSAMQTEFSALRAEVDRVANTAEFNGFKLLNGTNSSLNIQVGPDNTTNDRINVKLVDVNVSALSISGNSITSAGVAQTAIASLDTAITAVTKARASLGASESNILTAIQTNLSLSENLTAARSRIVDADFAHETASMNKYNVLAQAGTAMVAQANSLPSLALQLL